MAQWPDQIYLIPKYHRLLADANLPQISPKHSKNPKYASLRFKSMKSRTSLYAVQCGKCSKWRVIPTKEEYETIREKFIEDPWFCDKSPEVSCDDPGDVEYDASRLWVIDKPNIPKPPPNTTRNLVLRKNLSKFDAHYVMPNGKKLRSMVEVEKFLEAYPQYKDEISLSDFNFSTPKIMEDMFPSSKKMRITED